MGRTINHYIYAFGKDTSFGSYSVPYHPLFVLVKSYFRNDWHGNSEYVDKRALQFNYLTYPLYVMDCLDKDDDKVAVDKRLTDWKIADGTTLGNAFVVVLAKAALYYNGAMRINNPSRYTGSGRGMVDSETKGLQLVKKLCAYLCVAYRPYNDSYYGKDECLTAAGGAKAAISSLAYALWYDKDGARTRNLVMREAMQGYSTYGEFRRAFLESFDNYIDVFYRDYY